MRAMGKSVASVMRSTSNRYFYRYIPPRPLEEIDAELKTLEAAIAELLREVVT